MKLQAGRVPGAPGLSGADTPGALLAGCVDWLGQQSLGCSSSSAPHTENTQQLSDTGEEPEQDEDQDEDGSSRLLPLWARLAVPSQSYLPRHLAFLPRPRHRSKLLPDV